MPISTRLLWGSAPVTSENLRLEFEHLTNSINKILSNLGYTQTPTGAQIKARILALPDSKIPVQTIDGRVLAGKLNKASQKFASDIVFSTLDYDTVQWTAGYIQFADGTRYTISSGNTGNMSALTFIYFDPKVSTTVLQVTTDPTKIASDDIALLADAKNAPSSDLAPFWVAYNSANLNINQLSVNYLSSLSADMGSLTAGSIVVGSTNKLWLNSGADGNLRIGGSVYADAPLQVSAAGALTATSAIIKTANSGTRIEMGVSGTGYISGYLGAGSFNLVAASDGLETDVSTRYWLVIGGDEVYEITKFTDGGSGQKSYIKGGRFESNVVNSSPLVITSTTVCTNLNADLLDGSHASAFANASHTHATGDITSGYLPIARGGTFNVTYANGEFLIYNSAATQFQSSGYSSGSFASPSHTHATGDITSGTFADARIAASNVTQHQASLSIATSQLTGTIATAQIADNAVTSAKTSGLNYGSGSVTAITVVNGLVTAIVP